MAKPSDELVKFQRNDDSNISRFLGYDSSDSGSVSYLYSVRYKGPIVSKSGLNYFLSATSPGGEHGIKALGPWWLRNYFINDIALMSLSW